MSDGAGAASVVDKDYCSAKIRQQIAEEATLAVIPAKSNAGKPLPHDPHLYADRNIVERFFCSKVPPHPALSPTSGRKHDANGLQIYITITLK